MRDQDHILLFCRTEYPTGFQQGCLNSMGHFCISLRRKGGKGPAHFPRWRFSLVGLHNMSDYISLIRTHLNGPLTTGLCVSLNKFGVLLLSRGRMGVQSHQEVSAKERIKGKWFIFSSSPWSSSSLFNLRHNRRGIFMASCRKLSFFIVKTFHTWVSSSSLLHCFCSLF